MAKLNTLLVEMFIDNKITEPALGPGYPNFISQDIERKADEVPKEFNITNQASDYLPGRNT